MRLREGRHLANLAPHTLTHTHTVSVVLQASVVRQLRAGEPSKLRDLMRSWKVLVKPSGNQERKLMYTPQRSEFTVRSQGYIPAEALTNHMMCSHEVDPVFFSSLGV